MRLEIDIPKHHYNNIMALDSVNLGRVPYKGIIMYTINAIKHGKVLEQEPTTKNDLGVDCISREQALKELKESAEHHANDSREEALLRRDRDIIRALPSVTPQEPQTFKWCTDCKEYDQEKHCCHRWSKVIRDTVEEMKQEPEPKTGHWIKTPKAVMGEGYMWYCDKCEYQVYQDSSRDYPSEKYCPNCGCRMFELQESER